MTHSAIRNSALLALAASLAMAGSAQAATPSGGCGRGFRPFAHTRAQVEACGVKTFALQHVRALPGGGKVYEYDVDGHVARMRVAPRGFDAVHASNAQLDEYGLPPRPARATDYSDWAGRMSSLKMVPPPPFLVQSNMSADSVSSPNWAGYVVTGGKGSFNHAETRFYEPVIGGSRCSSTDEFTWAGLGGWGATDYLGQNGTGWDSGSPVHYGWFEVVPDNYNAISVNFKAHPGYQVDASTRRIAGGYRFFWHDYYSGTSDSLDYMTNSYTGDSAESIIERPTDVTTNKLDNLANFGTWTVLVAEANGLGMNTWSSTGGRHGVFMENVTPFHTTILADVGSIGSDGAFKAYQYSCN